MPANRQITITDVLWGGHKIFNHGKQEPWVGVKREKLNGVEMVDFVITAFKTAPLYSKVDAKAFLSLSDAQNWVKNIRGKVINHLPLSELKKLAQSVRE